MNRRPRSQLTIKNYVKPPVTTNDLIYVFCAAAWVNVSSNLAAGGLSISAGLLLAFTFALIPLELYTNSLWQRVASLFNNDPEDDARQSSVLATVDIFRVFGLTMSFTFLFIPVNILNQMQDVQKQSSAAPESFLFFTGLFLVMSFVWNIVVFTGQRNTKHAETYPVPDAASSQAFTEQISNNPYEQLFAVYLHEITNNNAGREFSAKVVISIVGFFKTLNWLLFVVLFPCVGCITLATAIVNHYSGGLFNRSVEAVTGEAALSIFGVECLFKVIQIILISTIINHVISSRTHIVLPLTYGQDG